MARQSSLRGRWTREQIRQARAVTTVSLTLMEQLKCGFGERRPTPVDTCYRNENGVPRVKPLKQKDHPGYQQAKSEGGSLVASLLRLIHGRCVHFLLLQQQMTPILSRLWGPEVLPPSWWVGPRCQEGALGRDGSLPFPDPSGHAP